MTAEVAPAPQPARFRRQWWASITPVPTPRLAAVVAVFALVSAFGPDQLGVWIPVAVVLSAAVVDAILAPSPWRIGIDRDLPSVLPMDGEGKVVWNIHNPAPRTTTIALADEFAPSLSATTRRIVARVPARGTSRAQTSLHPTRRGTFRPSAVTVRVAGPAGLVTRQATRSIPGELQVHPSFRSRDAAELRIRRARLLQEGLRATNVRGGDTEFEALREYVQGDEYRHVDWAATARAGHPVVRTYRAERNQTVLVLLDTGRVVAGLVDGVPRLDQSMDATMALGTVATALGDRIGMVAFGGGVRNVVAPRREHAQLRKLSTAMHALEPELAESNYREAFRTVLARFRRRALLVVLTELANEAVQETLLPALPLISRDHAVVVASVRDPAVVAMADKPVANASGAYNAAAAVQVLDDRRRAVAWLRAAGAHVVDAAPGELPAALTDIYLDVKASGRL